VSQRLEQVKNSSPADPLPPADPLHLADPLPPLPGHEEGVVKTKRILPPWMLGGVKDQASDNESTVVEPVDTGHWRVEFDRTMARTWEILTEVLPAETETQPAEVLPPPSPIPANLPEDLPAVKEELMVFIMDEFEDQEEEVMNSSLKSKLVSTIENLEEGPVIFDPLDLKHTPPTFFPPSSPASSPSATSPTGTSTPRPSPSSSPASYSLLAGSPIGSPARDPSSTRAENPVVVPQVGQTEPHYPTISPPKLAISPSKLAISPPAPVMSKF
jgi:hypothetical protein